jgi:hypothetical protein
MYQVLEGGSRYPLVMERPGSEMESLFEDFRWQPLRWHPLPHLWNLCPGHNIHFGLVCLLVVRIIRFSQLYGAELRS